MVVFSISSFAQKDVTKFMGIPVDGEKTEMIIKLIAKGFTYDKGMDILKGEFNGSNVKLTISTYKNKVRRIGVFYDFNSDETDIKIRFNNLVRQFTNNDRYIAISEDQTIPSNENISYEMSINSKRYEAYFYQKPDANNPQYIKSLRDYLLTKYSEEEISKDDIFEKKPYSDDINEFIYNSAIKKEVWFVISENSGNYNIFLMYDNIYNFPDGEDL